MDFETNQFLDKLVDEYIPFKDVLKQNNLSYEVTLKKSKEYYKEYLNLLKKLQIDTKSKESIYLSISWLSESNCSDDLLNLYCYMEVINIDMPSYNINEFEDKNPIIVTMVKNTINSNPDLVTKFISARFFKEDTHNIVKKIYDISKVGTRTNNIKKSLQLIENLLIYETIFNIENTFIASAENFI